MALSRRSKRIVLAVAVAAAAAAVAGGAFLWNRIVTYHADIWLPGYIAGTHTNDLDDIAGGHVMFLISDHHEPGWGAEGDSVSGDWCAAYRETLARETDDYGNPFRYTWFYPYDHANSAVVLRLNELVYDGLGEVEFHWHHGRDDNTTFPPKLAAAVDWFASHGCMLPFAPDSSPRFGFVHGNWALDNSTGKRRHCGVNRELDILAAHGCYGDFTMANLSPAQPRTINTLYYAVDTDGPKSYDTGTPAEVGRRGEGFLIFPGPICWDWHDLQFDCAGVEDTSPPRPHRVELWLRHAPAVVGRPDWLFLKVYTHGVPSRENVLGPPFAGMLDELRRQCERRGLSLHFVTAREAYNILRAAEDGLSEDPEAYRDYEIPAPVNSRVGVARRVDFAAASAAGLDFSVLEPDSAGYAFRDGAVAGVSGRIHRFVRIPGADGDSVAVFGTGVITLAARGRVHPLNPILAGPRPGESPAIYLVGALPPSPAAAPLPAPAGTAPAGTGE